MRFKDRQEFIDAQASEKITLAKIEAKERLYTFDTVGLVYSKVVKYKVNEVRQGDSLLGIWPNANIPLPGYYHYDIRTNVLSVRLNGELSPTEDEIIATYELYFSDRGVSLAHDLTDEGEEVFWDGRIVSSPGYSHKIGIEQALTSLVGSGNLKLNTEDGGLDDEFDTLIFENQRVEIYSWNKFLQPSESQIIYRGRVTNKTYDTKAISFTVKDPIFSLLDNLPLNAFTDDDNVSDNIKGQYKRRIYGRVDGLKCQSIDQISSGLDLMGTFFGGPASTTISSLGSGDLRQILFQGDTVFINTQEFEVESVTSPSEFIVNEEPTSIFSGVTASYVPSNGTELANRVFLAAGHECATITTNLLSTLQLNRLVVESTEGIVAGDFIELSTGERIQVENIAPGNIIVLEQNMTTSPAINTPVIRQPIQQVFIGPRLAPSDAYFITNTGDCRITFNDQVERILAKRKVTSFNLNFTSGSRVVTLSGDINLTDLLDPRDEVKANTAGFPVFFRVSSVADASFEMTNPSPVTGSFSMTYTKVDYLTDDSIVSTDILGATEDGLAGGKWISTVAQTQRDMIERVGIDIYDTQSFIDGEVDSPQLISMAIPENPTSKNLPTVKSLVDKLNKSVNSSLTLNNDLLIKFQTLNVFTGEELPIIKDVDVISWKLRSTNGKTYRTAVVSYRASDVDRFTQESGSKVIEFSSQFIDRYIGTNKVNQLQVYLYEERDAEIAAHRNLYYNRLGISVIDVTTDLRLEYLELGDVVVLDLDRMYKRLGDETTRKKVVVVVSKTVNGEKIKFQFSDLGNTFNTSSYITPGTAECWEDATTEDKLIYGYITDGQGIVNDEEDTAQTHLIS